MTDLIGPEAKPDAIAVGAMNVVTALRSTYHEAVEYALHLEVPKLDDDPTMVGLGVFNQKIATIRSHSQWCSQWLTRLAAEKNTASQTRRKAKAKHKAAFNRVLSTDEDVLKLEGGQTAKIALAHTKIDDEARFVEYAENIYDMVMGYYDALKLAHDNIADAKRDLMAQFQIIKAQIAIGEVNPDQFPIQRGGVGPAMSPLQETENQLTAEFDRAGGVTAEF